MYDLPEVVQRRNVRVVRLLHLSSPTLLPIPPSGWREQVKGLVSRQGKQQLPARNQITNKQGVGVLSRIVFAACVWVFLSLVCLFIKCFLCPVCTNEWFSTRTGTYVYRDFICFLSVFLRYRLQFHFNPILFTVTSSSHTNTSINCWNIFKALHCT